MFDGSQVNLLIAFLGGIITFFASCLLPLVPTYLAYLAGIATSKQEEETDKSIFKRRVFVNGVIFTLGFIFIFVLLGATTQTLGILLAQYKPLIRKISGIVFVIMGLFMLDVIKIQQLYQERKFELPKSLEKYKELHSFLVGMAFGFAWTPCIGPVLAVILFWSAQATTVWKGMSLLLAYGIGLGLPFIITALFFESISTKLIKTRKFGKILHDISAVIIILMGILLFLNKVEIISIQLLQFFNLNTLAV
ncbi:MAG: cytochrome c biogenesis protein CcdA [Candidatus Pacebacteria bacterium]|nr:cytochrome c biogenesis protein CcdA [Candidatus Paceibacterota bacterium]